MIEEYIILHNSTCEECGSEDDVVMGEDGELICTDCLFERTCEEMFKDYYEDEDDE